MVRHWLSQWFEGLAKRWLAESSSRAKPARRTTRLLVEQLEDRSVPPAITSNKTAAFVVGQAGSFTITTMGFPVATLSKTGTLPAGVTFTDNGNGTATLSGTPLAGSASATPYTFTIHASNGVGTGVTQTFKLTIHQAPTISRAADATFTVGKAGSFSVITLTADQRPRTT